MFYREVEDGYRLNEKITHDSKRYNQTTTSYKDDFSDGATGAFDIFSEAWWHHDKLCNTGKWDSGDKCTNWQASMVLFDVL